jgi:hypothetical protein
MLPLVLLPAAAAAQAPPVSGPVALQAEPLDEEGGGPRFVRVGVAAFGSAGTYRMTDLNQTISDLTPIARSEWGAPEITLDPIENGVGYGGSLVGLFREKWLVAVDYERVIGKSEVGGQLGKAVFEAPATAILATVGVAFYSGNDIQVGLGAGLGRYESDMTAEFVDDEEIVEKFSFGGDGLGQHYTMWIDSPALGKFRIFAMLGYRHARISDVSLDVEIPEPIPPEGLTFPVADDGNSLDWSGFMSRAALQYTFEL